MTNFTPLPDMVLEPFIKTALMEDLGQYGDITTQAVIPDNVIYKAKFNAREEGVLSGMQVAALTFKLVDASLDIRPLIGDGSRCKKGDCLMMIEGRASSILMGERVALNFASHLSGIASLTAAFAKQTGTTKTRITCTRKTTPGLRLLEKQAVLHGGGYNHRYSLSDAILIKDNHIAAAGGITAVLNRARDKASHMVCIEIEVDTLSQLEEVLEVGKADAVLLDNMDTDTLMKAVEMADNQIITEASGNMALNRIAEVSATGVDYISVGALTHSARIMDLGLDF